MAPTGSEFINKILGLSNAQREDAILNEFLEGNIPDFLRKFKPITINNLTYLCMSDYLSIGTDQDYCRMPMNPLTAQKIADQYDCTLPTRLMVKTIHNQAVNKLTPKPWGPPYDHTMDDTERFPIHNQTIQNQLIGKDNFALTSGSKKDIVLTNNLYPNNIKKKVAIFGWIQSNNQPIQDLNTHSHEVLYCDYSHGVRLIANDVAIDNSIKRISEIFNDLKTSSLLNDEGILKFQRY